MQYLDDELCNQICGLLINIHMEDRSKELEKKEMEKSGLFKSGPPVKQKKVGDSFSPSEKERASNPPHNSESNKAKQAFSPQLGKNRPQKFIEDLLISEHDLGIDENYSLERYTLQKMTLEWLNWNAQFFDYSEEPYLFYLADILSKDFSGEKNKGNLLYNQKDGISSQTSLHGRRNHLFPSETNSFPRGKGREGKWVALQEKRKEAMLTQSNVNKQIKADQEDLSQNLNLQPLNTPFNTPKKPSSRHDLEKKNQFLNFEFARLMMLFRNKTQKLHSSINSKKLPAQLFDFNLEKLKHLDVYSPFRLLSESVFWKQTNKKGFPLPILQPLLINSSLLSFSQKIENHNDRQSQKLKSNRLEKKLKTFHNAKKKLSETFFKNSSLAQILTTVPFNNRQALTNNEQLIPLSLRQSASSIEKRESQLKEEVNVKSHISSLLTNLAQQNLFAELNESETQLAFSKKTLSQKILRRDYKQNRPVFTSAQDLPSFKAKYHIEKNGQELQQSSKNNVQKGLANLELNQNMSKLSSLKPKPASYLNQGNLASEESYMEFRDYYRKQTESTLQEEESKKVFMIINSFGGSVGNGITVHDALQFIKAGSLTLALGVAASAASLALAGGTIGERYVTEGCHTMIHQPEGGLSGQASDIWIDSQEIMKIRLDVAEIYSLSTYRPRHKILRDLDRDFYLTASETIFYGLADEIATNEVLQDIISLTNQTWGFHDAQQQKLLERREGLNTGTDTQTQN